MSAARVVWAVIGLTVGLLFYVAYRSEQTVSNRLVTLVCGPARYAAIKREVAGWVPVSATLRGCLPSALWGAIGTCLLGGWQLRVGRRLVPLGLCCPLLNAGWEVVQWLGWTDGRADWRDVVAGVAGWALGWALFFREGKPPEEIAARWNWRMGVVVMGVACMGLADVWR